MHSNERATNKCWLCGSSFINRWFRGLGWIIQTMAFRCIYFVSWIRRVLNSNAYMYFMTLARFSIANYFQFDFQLFRLEVFLFLQLIPTPQHLVSLKFWVLWPSNSSNIRTKWTNFQFKLWKGTIQGLFSFVRGTQKGRFEHISCNLQLNIGKT